MPKIDAPTVAEHRANVRMRLIDAAESVLRHDPSAQLTAGAVTSAAGIARNSIYRYVDSVDDLRSLVLNRYLPDWMSKVEQAMATATTPQDRVITWVRSNLEQAAQTGHGWLMEAARKSSSPSMDEAVDSAHSGMRGALTEAWQDLLAPDEVRARVAVGLTVGLLDAGFRQLDDGLAEQVVTETVVAATGAMVSALSSGDRNRRG